MAAKGRRHRGLARALPVVGWLPGYERSGCAAQVLAILEADGIIDRIRADHVHGNVHLAVEAQLADAERHDG
jgi:hypothetical protein